MKNLENKSIPELREIERDINEKMRNEIEIEEKNRKNYED